jgi:hypothetical protein
MHLRAGCYPALFYFIYYHFIPTCCIGSVLHNAGRCRLAVVCGGFAFVKTFFEIQTSFTVGIYMIPISKKRQFENRAIRTIA